MSKRPKPLGAADRNQAFRAFNDSTMNPESPSGTSGTAAMQKANVAKSEKIKKQPPNLGTPAASEAMRKSSTP